MQVVNADGQIRSDLEIDTNKEYGDFGTLLLTPGTWFSDHNGEVEITKEQVLGIAKTYNEYLDAKLADPKKPKRLLKFLGTAENRPDPNLFLGAQVRVDHSFQEADAVKGRVRGKLWVENGDSDMPELWGTLRILGAENVTKVIDTRYHNVSVTFHPKTFELVEVSFVTKGACHNARVEDDKLAHPVALSSSNSLDKNKFVTENDDSKLKLISLINKALRVVDNELISLKQKKEVTIEVKSLMHQGIILPRHYRAGLVNDLMLMAKHEDRLRTLRLLGMVAPQVDTSIQTNNINAMMGTQMVLEADPTVKKAAQKFYKGVYTQLKGKTNAEKQDILLKLNKAETGFKMEEKPDAKMMNEGADEDADRYMEHVHEMLEAGKHEELKEELKERKKKKLSAKEEGREDDLNEKDKKEHKDEEEKLSAVKQDLLIALEALVTKNKDEVKLMLSEAINKHDVVLTKMIEDHKELIQLAATANKELSAEANKEEK